MATLTFAAALNAALADEMAADDMVVVFGCLLYTSDAADE